MRNSQLPHGLAVLLLASLITAAPAQVTPEEVAPAVERFAMAVDQQVKSAMEASVAWPELDQAMRRAVVAAGFELTEEKGSPTFLRRLRGLASSYLSRPRMGNEVSRPLSEVRDLSVRTEGQDQALVRASLIYRGSHRRAALYRIVRDGGNWLVVDSCHEDTGLWLSEILGPHIVPVYRAETHQLEALQETVATVAAIGDLIGRKHPMVVPKDLKEGTMVLPVAEVLEPLRRRVEAPRLHASIDLLIAQWWVGIGRRSKALEVLRPWLDKEGAHAQLFRCLAEQEEHFKNKEEAANAHLAWLEHGGFDPEVLARIQALAAEDAELQAALGLAQWDVGPRDLATLRLIAPAVLTSAKRLQRVMGEAEAAGLAPAVICELLLEEARDPEAAPALLSYAEAGLEKAPIDARFLAARMRAKRLAGAAESELKELLESSRSGTDDPALLVLERELAWTAALLGDVPKTEVYAARVAARTGRLAFERFLVGVAAEISDGDRKLRRGLRTALRATPSLVADLAEIEALGSYRRNQSNAKAIGEAKDALRFEREGAALLAAGDAPAAKELAEQRLKKEKNDVSALFLLLDAEQALDQAEAALSAAKLGMAKAPLDRRPRFALEAARLALTAGDADGAKTYLEKALDKCPGWRAARALEIQLTRASDTGAADALIKKYAKDDPGFEAWLEARGPAR